MEPLACAARIGSYAASKHVRSDSALASMINAAKSSVLCSIQAGQPVQLVHHHAKALHQLDRHVHIGLGH